MKIDSIQNGIVLDHITAGNAMRLYYDLGLDKTGLFGRYYKKCPQQ